MEPVISTDVRPAFVVEAHDPGFGAFCDDDSVILAAQHRRCADGVFRTLYKQTLRAKELKKTKRRIAQRVKALRLGRPVRRAKRIA